MSIYAVSDIHGNKEAWESIKEQINFSKDDQMYILGDVVDRGDYGIEILMEIIESRNMYMILGNHEDMMLNAITNNTLDDVMLWYRNGGQITHEKYINLLPSDQYLIIDYLNLLPLERIIYVGNKEIYICHANSETVYWYAFHTGERRIFQDVREFCTWDRRYIDDIEDFVKLKDNEYLIHGHTPTIQRIGDVYIEGQVDNHSRNVYNIDCGAGYPQFNGRLACINLNKLVNNEESIVYSKR